MVRGLTNMRRLAPDILVGREGCSIGLGMQVNCELDNFPHGLHVKGCPGIEFSEWMELDGKRRIASSALVSSNGSSNPITASETSHYWFPVRTWPCVRILR